MKKFVFTFVAVAAVAALTVTSFAQGAGPKGGTQGGAQGQRGQGGPGGGREAMKKRMEEMIKKLNLSADQKKSWEKVATAQREEMQAMRKKNEGKDVDRQKMMKEFMAMREKYQAKFMKILNPKQQEQYKKMMEEMRKQFQGRGGAGGPGGRPGAGGGAPKGGGGKGGGGGI